MYPLSPVKGLKKKKSKINETFCILKNQNPKYHKYWFIYMKTIKKRKKRNTKCEYMASISMNN